MQRILLVLISLLFLLAGCGGKKKELNLYAWSEYVPQEVIDGFTKETGIKVNYETFSANEEMIGKLGKQNTRYDLIQPSEYTVEALVKVGRLAALDARKLSNLKNIDPALRDLPHDRGLHYSVPWMTGTVGIVVNTAKVKDPIRSYQDVFQDKYKGRIVVVNDNREIVTWAMSTLDIPAESVTPENLEKVRPVLARWIKLIKVFDSDSPKTPLLAGDVDLGVVWSGEAALILATDKRFSYVLPTEGAHMFIDSLAIPTGAPNPDGAHLFIDYILRPEVSKLISDKFPYTNPNLRARELLTPAQRANMASYPKESLRTTFRDIGKAASSIDKLMTDLKAAN